MQSSSTDTKTKLLLHLEVDERKREIEKERLSVQHFALCQFYNKVFFLGQPLIHCKCLRVEMSIFQSAGESTALFLKLNHFLFTSHKEFMFSLAGKCQGSSKEHDDSFCGKEN